MQFEWEIKILIGEVWCLCILVRSKSMVVCIVIVRALYTQKHKTKFYL